MGFEGRWDIYVMKRFSSNDKTARPVLLNKRFFHFETYLLEPYNPQQLAEDLRHVLVNCHEHCVTFQGPLPG